MSLFTRLLLIIVAALLPPLAMQAFNETALHAERQADVREQAGREARDVDAELRRITDGVRNTLVALAEVPAIRAGEPVACEQLLRAVRAAFVVLRDMELIGAGGIPRCDTAGAPPRARGDTSAIVLARQRDAFALGAFELSWDGHPVLPMAYPVRGVPGAVLVADFDLGWLHDQLLAHRLPEGSALGVTDRDGRFLVRLPDDPRLGDTIAPAFRGLLKQSEQGVTEATGMDGVRRIIGYVPLDSAPRGLFVAVGFSTDHAYAASDAAAARGYALIAAGLLTALGLAAWMVRGSITRPVRAILATTERWRGGDTTARVALPPEQSEFGRIGSAVNDLLDAIAAGQAGLRERLAELDALRRAEAALQATLQRANAELERRVAERTHQLSVEVAEREAAQAQLQQAQKMELLGQLTGGVAHDFNNLLTAIIGNLELALAKGGDRPELARLLGAGLRAAERGAALTQRMLAFGRRQYLRFESVPIPPLLEGMADLLARTIGPPVSVRIVAAGTMRPARADPNQVELLVLNLAVNARDAMPRGGTITIAAREEDVPEDAGHPARLAPGCYVRITVSDTGSGMDTATRARAFEPFFTTKPVGRGSGLGLSMVQGVAEQSGGGVAIESAPGVGTSVSVWLPCAEDAGEAPGAPADAEQAGAP